MKTIIKPLSIRVALVTLLAGASLQTGCRSTQPPGRHPITIEVPRSPVTIEVTGTTGALVTVQYIADGQRTQRDGVVPMTIRQPGVLKVLVAKNTPADEVSYLIEGRGGSHGGTLPAGNPDGILYEREPWGHARPVKMPMTLLPPLEGTLVLWPYHSGDAWVFDDPQMNLVREPLVKDGRPPHANAADRFELLTYLLKDIPDAKAGFKLTVSRHPFRGWQHKLTCVGETGDGWSIYSIPDPRAAGRSVTWYLKGWLSPVVYRYFNLTPSALYVRAEPK